MAVAETRGERTGLSCVVGSASASVVAVDPVSAGRVGSIAVESTVDVGTSVIGAELDVLKTTGKRSLSERRSRLTFLAMNPFASP